MNRITVMFVVVALVAATSPRTAPAAKEAKKPRAPRRKRPPKVKDIPGLPRVLLIGDSISIGYTRPTRALLKGKVNLHRIPGNAQHTGTGVKMLAKWLGDGKWDVIHFNWGLWDLCYRNPKSKTQGRRDKVNGKLTLTLEQYEKNLTQIVKQLKATKAKLIWATTTPVPAGEAGRIKGDELKYNAAAKKIMAAHGIAINDLHAHILPKADQFYVAKGNVHFNAKGCKHLAEKVAAAILESLGKKPKPTTKPAPQRPKRP
jgi:lysophospholipase L1-like esterase